MSSTCPCSGFAVPSPRTAVPGKTRSSALGEGGGTGAAPSVVVGFDARQTRTPNPEDNPGLLASTCQRPGLGARIGTSTRDAPARTVTCGELTSVPAPLSLTWTS